MSVYEEAESWATSRMSGLGGSDVPAVLGLSPFRRPIDVWEAKVFPERVPELDKECLWFGTALEPIIRQRYAMVNGVEIIEPKNIGTYFPHSTTWNDQTIVRGQEPWQLGAADGIIPSEQEGFEAKNVGRRDKSEWGTEGTDEIPAMYLVQVHWYIDVYSYKAWRVAPLFAGNTLGNYLVKRDPELAKEMHAAARDFWFSYVVPKVEPPVDESENYGKYLARKFSLNTGKVLRAPSEEICRAAAMLRFQQQALKDQEQNVQLAKNELAIALGDADAAITPDGKVGWVRPAERNATDWQKFANSLRGYVSNGIWEESLASNTKPMKPSPYLRGWFK